MASPLFCAGCHTLFAGSELNHFEVFGLPQRFDLEPELLRRRYLEQSRQIHPDQLSATGADPALGLRSAARLNEAFRVLKDPLSRAEYLLEVAGGKSSAEDKSVPQDVLAETLMLREEIEEAREADDATALAALRTQVTERFAAQRERVTELAKQLPGDAALRTELRTQLNAMKYYQKMLEQF
jgi:molecular chaperone HscB